MGRHTLSCRKASQGGKVMPELFVGIDVAKDTSSAQGIDSNGKGRFFLDLYHGLGRVYAAVESNSGTQQGSL